MRVWNNLELDNWDTPVIHGALEGNSELIPNDMKSNGKKTILYCAQPKSASLYITKLLAKTFKAKEYWIGFNKGSGELYFPRFLGALQDPALTISHCHSRADNKLVTILKKTNPVVIVSYRNLLDTLVSRRDMFIKDGGAAELLSDSGTRDFINASPKEQLDIVIELYAQQYINFYASWKRVAKQFDVFFIKYGSFINNQKSVLSKLSEHIFNKPLAINADNIAEDIMNAGGVNFNKGKKGRGNDLFTESQKDRIKEIAAIYNLEDSEYLGI